SSQLIRLDLLEAKFFVNTKGKGEEKISDDMVKALWKITEEGAEHVKVKQIVKTTEKLMSNIKASIRRSEIESFDEIKYTIMAKARVINTRFWDDHYTADLDPIEKLLFLYILTNTSTNISVVYEIPHKKIANETGIDKEMVQKILERFDRDNKVFYVEGWMWVKNFIKNQNQKSPLVQKGIETELKAVPSHIRQIVEEKIKGIDTVSHLTQSNLTKLNSTKSNLTQSICETSFSQEG